MKGSQVTVLCVDDHNLVRECMAAIIDQQPGLLVAGQARTVKGAIDCFTESRPDVTLVSMQPRGLNCLQIIRAIRRVDPRARIVVYARDESEAVYLALDAGAAIAQMTVEAVSRGLIAHPMAGFDVDGAREAFGIPAQVRPLAVVALGVLGDYTDVPDGVVERDSRPRERLPLAQIAFAGRWDQPLR